MGIIKFSEIFTNQQWTNKSKQELTGKACSTGACSTTMEPRQQDLISSQ